MKKLIISAILTGTLSCGAAAAGIEPKIVYDYSNNEIRVSGDVGEEAKRVSFMILDEGIAFKDLKNTKEDASKIFYAKQADNVSGKFTFEVGYDAELKAGLYNARLNVGGESVDIENISLVSAEDFKKAVDEVNGYAEAGVFDDFKENLEKNVKNLGFNSEYLKMLKDDTALKAFMDEVKTNPLSKTDSVSNQKVFNSYVLLGALYDETTDNIDPIIKRSIFAESDTLDEYQKYVKTEDEQKYVTAKMSGTRYSTFDEFKVGLKKAMLLNGIYYADGYEAVQDIISVYGDLAGIVEASNTVARGLVGKDFADTDALYKKYKELKDDDDDSSSSGSGGSSSGGSRNNIVSNIVTDVSATDRPNVIKKNEFTDIEGVEWAVESINALYDKGIVNGRSETLFEPNEFVTREEFVKILVSALGYQNESYTENVFQDVSDDDWFVSYVNIAYDKKLVNGVGDNNFGSGSLISRQDMAVMIYNALLSEGVECPDGSKVFSDDEAMADYAKAAVKSLYEMNIVNGVSETEFDPVGNATRAEAAKIVYGILSYIG